MVTLSDKVGLMLDKTAKGSWPSCPLFFLLAPSPITAPAMGLMTLENIHSNMELVERSELSGHVWPGQKPSIWPWK